MAAPLWTPGTLKQPGDIVRPTSAGNVTPEGPDNPFFDDGPSGWTFTGDGNAVINTASPVFNGAYSLKANDTGGNNQKVATNNARLPVTPGQVVTIRCYVQCVGDADRTRIQPRINWYTSGAVLISPTVLATDPSIIGDGFVRVTPGLDHSGGLVGLAAVGVWVLLEVTGVAPPDAATWTPAVAFNWGPDGAWACDYFTWEYASQEPPNNNLYRAVQAAAGFTANIEPDWPTTVGQTIVDNEVTWECVSGNSVTWEAHRILVSGDTEPVWPLQVNAAVPDNTISWSLNPRRVVDPHVPQSKIGMLAAKKIFSPDEDIINFSATVNPLDWTTEDDAGFLPFGLNVYGANPVAAMGLYRGNLVAFNSQGCQIWQVDPDPANMSFLDAVPIPCTYPRSLSPVGDDLVLLTDKGIRSLNLVGPSINLQSGYFGKQVDPLVVAALKVATAAGYEPLALYWPAQGQYWLIFENQAFVLTINGPKQEQKSWSRYTFPWTIDHWTLLGTDLYLRAGDLVEKVDVEALYDDLHTEATQFLELEAADQYDTDGWLAGQSSVDVGETQNHENDTPVQLVGPPHIVPTLYVLASTTQVGSTNQSIIASFDNGATWSAMAMPAGGLGFCGAAHSANRKEIVFLQANGQLLKSVDGTTVVNITSNLNTISTTLQDICRNADDSLYIACGDAGVIATSPDALTWTQRSAPTKNYRKFLVTNDGHVLCGSSLNTGQPIAISADGGLTWASNTAFGFNSTVYELAESASGRYEFGTRDNNFTISTPDLAAFTQIAGLTSQTALGYATSADLFVACSGPADPNGIYSSPGSGAQAWTARTTGLGAEYKNVEDIISTYTGGVIGIRPSGSGVSAPTIVRSPTVIGNWSFTQPAQFNANAVYSRIYEFGLELNDGGGINTHLFTDRTLTGDKGDTTVTASGPVLGIAGDRVFVKYPAEGPFTAVAGGVVGSVALQLSAPLEDYVDQYTVLRIERVGGVDFNYLRAAVEPGDTILSLIFPLEHIPISITAFPYGTLVLNTVDDTVAYAALELASSTLTPTLELADPLPADAVALEFIVRPYQRTTVQGGQGTDSVVLEDLTDFVNDATHVPEAGFPAAPAIVGDFIEFDTGTDIVGVVQWPFLDLNNFNADKELQAFDLSIFGVATISFGWDQRQLDFSDDPQTGTWTEPYEVVGDTVPGTPLPYSVTAASFSMRLEFAAGQAWKWYSSNMYINDETQ